MKLLIITGVPFVLPPVEAYAKQIWILARELKKEGFDCEILCLPKFSISTCEFAKKHGINLLYRRSSLSPFEIIRKKNRFNLVHFFTHMAKTISYSCVTSEILNKLGHTPLVFTVYNSECNHFWESRFMGIPLVTIFQWLDYFTVFSHKQLNILKHFLPKANIFILPPITDRVPQQQIMRSSTPSILYMGDFVEHKGVFDLISAFKMVLEAHADAKLVLCIRGIRYINARQKAYEYVLRKGLEKNIIVKGAVNPWYELSRAWIYVYPFRGLRKSAAPAVPLSLIEAIKTGTPIVATRTGAISEFFPDDVIANPGSPDDLCEKILVQLDKTRRQLPQLPSRFTDTDIVIAQYKAFYDYIC